MSVEESFMDYRHKNARLFFLLRRQFLEVLHASEKRDSDGI